SSEQISELLTHLDERVDDILLSSRAGSVSDGHGEEPSLTLPAPGVEAPRTFPLEPERWSRLLADARRLLGRPMHLSLHPGGIVITPMPIDNYVPVQWAAKGVVMTQLDKDGVEAVGLVKIDLLGNRALSAVDEAKQLCAA